MENRPAITIIGTGAVGSALLDFFSSEGFPVQSYWNSRGGFIHDKETGEYSAAPVSFPSDETVLGEWIFVATPDGLIASTCGKLAEIPAEWNRKSVIHCSGNMTSGVCRAVADKGAVIASLHPLQTFTRGDNKERLKDIHISLEGDETLTSRLKQMVVKMGAKPVKLDPSQKQALHIAAVFASNYLIALLCTAENLLKEEGIDNGLNILEPLIRQTLSNVFKRGVDNALTGPVSRGDDISVKEHLEVLAKNPDHHRLYQLLGKEALLIATKQNRLTDDQVEKLKALFE
ncbi:MAG: DUF2520 domain-containing protein [Balneolaceae bacterium]